MAVKNAIHILVKNLRGDSSPINLSSLVKVLFALSYAATFLTLYLMYPDSYERTWKGRAYYFFFMWLVLLELALNWEKITVKVQRVRSKRFMASAAVMILPTLYVLAADFSGLNTLIIDLSPKHYGLDHWSIFMPLTVEYLVFTALSLLLVVLSYGAEGLRRFLLPINLIGVVGLTFLIDSIYPFGEFTPFQTLVPSTAILTSKLLTLLGYKTELRGQIHGTQVLRAWSEKGEASFGIAWPCSGIDSLIMYSIITALFLRENPSSRRQKVAYFLIGAVVTYFINIIRVAKIFILAIEHGASSWKVQRFHDHYGPLYSITWIIIYQLIIFCTQLLSRRLAKRVSGENALFEGFSRS
ncbi:MAG: archaeosortase/exosortase family protein [Candidatus Bathyarchaeota archaeon]|nr:archaeosortase/exosortase family protein [Candidatus Bathyarchaeota archaeon]